MRVGITGHQRLDAPSDWTWVEQQINNLVNDLPDPVVGITSLAIGADQVFARSVLRRDGSLEVIVPFDDYERTFVSDSAKFEYNRLLRAASKVEVLKRTGSDEEAYLAAGKLVVDKSSLVVAVWNGTPAAGLGGTADIVRYARERGKGVIHLNPRTHAVVEYRDEPLERKDHAGKPVGRRVDMSLPQHTRTQKGSFRRARGDELAGNLAKEYPEFKAFRSDTRLDTIRDRLGVHSIDAIRAKIRKSRKKR